MNIYTLRRVQSARLSALLVVGALVSCRADRVTSPSESAGPEQAGWQVNTTVTARWSTNPRGGVESLVVTISPPRVGAELVGFRIDLADSAGQAGLGRWQPSAADSAVWMAQTPEGMLIAGFTPGGQPLPLTITLNRPLRADQVAVRPIVRASQLAFRLAAGLRDNGVVGARRITPRDGLVLGPAGSPLGDSTGHQLSAWGDLDRSGTVDFGDAMLAVAAGVGTVDTATITIGLGDADSSGTVSTRDALIIARFVAGLAPHPYLGQPVGAQIAVVQPGAAQTVMSAGGASVELGAGELSVPVVVTIEEVLSDSSTGQDSTLGPAFDITVGTAGATPGAGAGARTSRGFRGQLRVLPGRVSTRAAGSTASPRGTTGLAASIGLPLWRSAKALVNPNTYVRFTTAGLSYAAYQLNQVGLEVSGLVSRFEAEVAGWAAAASNVKVRVQAWVHTTEQCRNLHLASQPAPPAPYLNVVLIHGIQLITDPRAPPVLQCAYYGGTSLDIFWQDVETKARGQIPVNGRVRFHRLVYPTENAPTVAGQRLAALLADGSSFGGQPVMLVAHSMGGLVAAEALRLSRPSVPIVRLATFGTPFLGSRLAEPAATAEVCLAGGALVCAGAVYFLFPTPGLQSLRPTDTFITETLKPPPQRLLYAYAGNVLNVPGQSPLIQAALLFAWPDVTDPFPLFGNDGIVKVSSGFRFPDASHQVSSGTDHMQFNTQLNVAGAGLDFTAATVANLAATAPVQISIVSGDQQTVPAGQNAAPMVVDVRDLLGQPVAGETVTFSPGWTQAQQVATDANGQATLVAQAPAVAGQFTVQATVDGLPSVVFTITASLAAQTIATVSGDNQLGARNTALPLPLVVEVRDANGTAVSGVTVDFGGIPSGGGSVQPTSAVTNAQGQAQTTWTMGVGAGTMTADATIRGTTAKVTFTASTILQLVKVSGDGQTGAPGAALAQPLKVEFTEASGTPISGQTVTFAVTAGGGSVAPLSTTTDAQGLAQTSWTLGTSGAQSATASVSVGANGSPATFSAVSSASPIAPSSLVAVAGGSSAVSVSWIDNAPDEDGFEVEVATGPNGPFTLAAIPAANATAFDFFMSPTTRYYFRVAATRSGVRSSYSNTATAQTLSEFPSASATTATVLNGVIYTFGVNPNGYAFGGVYSYQPGNDVWQTLRYFGGTSIAGYTNVSSAVPIGGKIYVTGGSGWGYTQSILNIYDPSSDTWSAGPDHPTPTTGGVAGTIGGLLYVYTPSDTNSLYGFDPGTQAWSQLPSPPRKLLGRTGGTIGGRFYLVGGYDTQTGALSGDVDILDPVTQQWSSGAPMRTPRYLASAAVDGGTLYVAGGLVPGSSYCGHTVFVEAYDASTDTWRMLRNLRIARSGAGVGVVGTHLYVIGGVISCFGLPGDQTHDVEVLDISSPPAPAPRSATSGRSAR